MPMQRDFLPYFTPLYFANFQLFDPWFRILSGWQKSALTNIQNLGLSNFNISFC